jgi:hypothetical protein
MNPKEYLLLAILLTIVCPQIKAQQQSHPNKYIPVAGDTLDSSERERYGLFPTIGGFQWSAFRRNEDSSMSAVVCVLHHGVRHNFVIKRFGSLSELENETERLCNNEVEDDQEREEKARRPQRDEGAEIEITLRNDSILEGELFAVGDTAIVLSHGNQKQTILCADIRKIVVHGESKVLLGMGIGLGVGVVTGAVIGAATAEKEHGELFESVSKGLGAAFFGALLGGVGLAVGAIAGSASSIDDQVIEDPRREDLIALKALARYPEMGKAI